ncbi:hypothetical protein ACH4Y0_32115 [Streptomyces sp. NPDC020707]|uniref:hypothetical protein n=1 Tax=Streptomyces TaxID=1883 RepID=UPI0028D567F7|nr:hypothetical protein [Streptomyces sp. DSM 40484]
MFFAAHATRGEWIDKTKAKIRDDLEGCLQEHQDVKVWRFLTNDTLPDEVDQFVDNELRPLYQGVTVEVWGLKRLADEISKLKRAQIDRIIDVIPVEEPEFEVVILKHVNTGRDLWSILSGSPGWLEHEEPEDCTDVEQDLIDSAVQSFRDWSDISGYIEFSRPRYGTRSEASRQSWKSLRRRSLLSTRRRKTTTPSPAARHYF